MGFQSMLRWGPKERYNMKCLMEDTNRVEPLMKQENELKIRPYSVFFGAQINKHVWLRNVTKISSKRGKVDLPLKA